MTHRRLSILIVPAVFVAALAAASAATSSSTSGGITVRPMPVDYALEQVEPVSGAAIYTLAASATWNPVAPATEGAFVIKNLDDGSTTRIGFGQTGGERGSESDGGAWTAQMGARYVLSAKWRVYVVSAFDPPDGTAQSAPVSLNVPGPEPVRRLPSDTKDKLKAAAVAATLAAQVALVAAMCCPVPVLFVVAAVSIAATGALLYMARDPVDLRFRAVAKPRIPKVPAIAPGSGVSAAAATALTRLLGAQAREIGLARAILTAFNRSQGAFVKKQPVWERKQMLAAGRYAADLSKAVRAEAQLRAQLGAALSGSPLDAPVDLEDVAAAQSEIVRTGLPSQLAATLSKLGLTQEGKRELRARMLGYDPGRMTGSPVSALSGPLLIASLRALADDLMAFSKRAARDPLHTGQ